MTVQNCATADMTESPTERKHRKHIDRLLCKRMKIALLRDIIAAYENDPDQQSYVQDVRRRLRKTEVELANMKPY